MTVAKNSRRGRPTPLQLEKRKQRVLEVAGALFVRHGFAGTTVSEIAKRSRVSPRLISAHFGDKTRIFAEVIRENNSQALHLAEETGPGGSLEEILFGVARFAWTMAYSPSAISFLRLLVGEGGRFTDKTSEIAKRASDDFFGRMEGIFIDLMQRGLVPDGDAQRLAKYFVDLIVGFSLVQAGMGYWDRVPDDDEIKDKIGLFCRSIALPQA